VNLKDHLVHLAYVVRAELREGIVTGLRLVALRNFVIEGSAAQMIGRAH
jgi:hypothetical protein